MDYNIYKSSIKSGDLLAWSSSKKSRGILAVLEYIVRLFTMSEYYHVGIAYVEGEQLYVFEAVIPEVRMQPLEKETPFFHISMNVNWNEDLLTYLKNRVGEKYSIWEAISGFFSKPDLKNKEWECAELAHEFYKKAGVDLGHAWTPSELVEKALERDDARMAFVEPD